MKSERIHLLEGLGVPRNVAETLARTEPDRQPGRIEFRNQGDGEAEILLYDFIGLDDMGGMSPRQFREELQAARNKKLTVRINSPGGDVWDGYAIYNMLANHPSPVRVVVEGIAASAASLIAMAGSTIDAYQTAQLMIHDAWTVVLGNQQELLEVAEVLGKIDGQIADVYARVSGRPAAEWRKVMDKDSYLTAREAKDKGLIDNVLNASNSSRAKPRTRQQVADQVERAKLGLLGISASTRDDMRQRVRDASADFQSQKPINRNSERWISSIHESAHAVVAIAQGQRCYGLGLYDDGHFEAAYCRLDNRRLTLPTLYAGGVAELKASGRSYQRPGGTDAGDETTIRNMIHREIPYDGEAADSEREELKARGRSQASKLVNRHWATIQQVASKLYSRGRLTGDDVARMVNTREPAASK